MKVPVMLKKAGHRLKDNSPTLLSGVAVVGVVSTAYLASRATVAAYDAVNEAELKGGTADDFKERWKERAKVGWRFYIPAGASGAVTIGCIVGSTKISARRAGAAQAAFVLVERAYDQYRSHVIEEIGEKKDQAIRDKIAEEKVRETPPPSTIISSPGNVLCCELMTGRYFTSDMETLRKRKNDLNEMLLRHDRASLDDWYDMIGLAGTSLSSEVGWWSDRQMELEFTSILVEDGRPCLAFDYNYTRPLYGGVFE